MSQVADACVVGPGKLLVRASVVESRHVPRPRQIEHGSVKKAEPLQSALQYFFLLSVMDARARNTDSTSRLLLSSPCLGRLLAAKLPASVAPSPCGCSRTTGCRTNGAISTQWKALFHLRHVSLSCVQEKLQPILQALNLSLTRSLVCSSGGCGRRVSASAPLSATMVATASTDSAATPRQRPRCPWPGALPLENFLRHTSPTSFADASSCADVEGGASAIAFKPRATQQSPSILGSPCSLFLRGAASAGVPRAGLLLLDVLLCASVTPIDTS